MVSYVEVIIYFLLHNLHEGAFKRRKFPWRENLANTVNLSRRSNLPLKGTFLRSFQNPILAKNVY